MMKWVMKMSNERTPYLQELMRLSSEATLLIPSIVFNEEICSSNRFKSFRNALHFLKNDDNLIITEKEVEGDFTEVNIRIRDDIDV